MSCSWIRIALILIVLNQLLTPSVAFRSGGSRGSGKRTKTVSTPALPPQNTGRRGLGISAWGIVVLVVSLALAGMGFYYFSMCYPIICQKNNKYDMMGLPSMA